MDKLAYKKIGFGKKLLIVLHEWMGDSSNYETSTRFFNTDDITSIFVDLRGYGASKKIKGSYTLEESTQDVKNIINELSSSYEEIHLLGHSMSSLIVQKLSLDKKINLKSIILVTPIAPSGIKMKTSAKQALLENVKNENNIIENVVKSASKRYTKTWEKSRINLAHNCSTLEAKLGYMNMYLNCDLSSNFDNFDLKTLILVGKNDLPTFHKNSIEKEFKKYFTNFKIVQIDDAGHYPMIETPVIFASEIEKFILD